jgi:hypothetical protein
MSGTWLLVGGGVLLIAVIAALIGVFFDRD